MGAELLVGEITAVIQVGQALEIGDSRALLAAVRAGRACCRERRQRRVSARREPAADRARGIAELRASGNSRAVIRRRAWMPSDEQRPRCR